MLALMPLESLVLLVLQEYLVLLVLQEYLVLLVLQEYLVLLSQACCPCNGACGILRRARCRMSWGIGDIRILP